MSKAFKKAEKTALKLRMAIKGVTGSGKTYTSLLFALSLGKKVAVIDTEHGSASKYADIFSFDVLELSDYSIEQYIAAIKAAEDAGYDVLVIDSLTHAWSGEGGALSQVDSIAAQSQSANTFGAWRQVTPLQNKLVNAILGAKIHIIATMRSKTKYILEDVYDKNGRSKKVPKKVGLAPIQRGDLESEFDVTCDMTSENSIYVTKSRCPSINHKYASLPDASFIEPLKVWLSLEKSEKETKTETKTETAQDAPPEAQKKQESDEKAAQKAGLDFDALIERVKTHDEARELYVKTQGEWAAGNLSKEKVYEYKSKIQAKVRRLSDATPAQGGAV